MKRQKRETSRNVKEMQMIYDSGNSSAAFPTLANQCGKVKNIKTATNATTSSIQLMNEGRMELGGLVQLLQ